MILRIARRDFTELMRDGRLIGAGALVLLLLLTALVVGWQRQADSRSERVTAQQLDYDDWLAQPARHPHDAAHQGLHVFKPEMPLSMIDPGVTPFVGSTLWLQAHRQSEVKFRPAQDATGLQRFGSFSPAWILQVLGPLLVIVLGFNAFTAEREQGTLRQLLSMGVPTRRRGQDSRAEYGIDDTAGTIRCRLHHCGAGRCACRGLQINDHAGYEVMDRHFAALWDAYADQQMAQEWFGALAPTLAIRAYSMRVAGTDFDQHRAFSTAAEQHRRKMQDLVSRDLVQHADERGEKHFSYRASTQLWREVPPFDFRPDAIGAALLHAGRSLGVLALALIAAWMLALTATRRLMK